MISYAFVLIFIAGEKSCINSTAGAELNPKTEHKIFSVSIISALANSNKMRLLYAYYRREKKKTNKCGLKLIKPPLFIYSK